MSRYVLGLICPKHNLRRRNSVCRLCHRERSKAWNRANPEKVDAARARHRARKAAGLCVLLLVLCVGCSPPRPVGVTLLTARCLASIVAGPAVWPRVALYHLTLRADDGYQATALV